MEAAGCLAGIPKHSSTAYPDLATSEAQRILRVFLFVIFLRETNRPRCGIVQESAHRRLELEEDCEFKVGLGYIESPRFKTTAKKNK